MENIVAGQGSGKVKPPLPRSKPGSYSFQSRPSTQPPPAPGAVLTGYRKMNWSPQGGLGEADVNANPPTTKATSNASTEMNRTESDAGPRRPPRGVKPALQPKPSPTSSPKVPMRKKKQAGNAQSTKEPMKESSKIEVEWSSGRQGKGKKEGLETMVVDDYEEEPRRLGRRITVEICTDSTGNVRSSMDASVLGEPALDSIQDAGCLKGNSEKSAEKPSQNKPVKIIDQEPKRRAPPGPKPPRPERGPKDYQRPKPPEQKPELKKEVSKVVSKEQSLSQGKVESSIAIKDKVDEHINGNKHNDEHKLPVVEVKETPVFNTEKFTLVEGSFKNGYNVTTSVATENDIGKDSVNEVNDQNCNNIDQNGQLQRPLYTGYDQRRAEEVSKHEPMSPIAQDVADMDSLASRCSPLPVTTVVTHSSRTSIHHEEKGSRSSSFEETRDAEESLSSSNQVPKQRISLKGPQQPVLKDEPDKATSVESYSSQGESPSSSQDYNIPKQRISLKGPQKPVLEEEEKRTSIGSYSSPAESPCSSPAFNSPRQRISLKGPQEAILQDEQGRRTSGACYGSPVETPRSMSNSPTQKICLKGPERAVLEEEPGKRTSFGSYSSPAESPCSSPGLNSPRQRVSLKGPQKAVLQEEPGKRTSFGSYSSPAESPCSSPSFNNSPRQRISLKGPQEQVLIEEQGKQTSISSSPTQKISLKGPERPVLDEEPGKRTSFGSYSSPAESPCSSPGLNRQRISLRKPKEPVLVDEPGNRTSTGSYQERSPTSSSPSYEGGRHKISLKEPNEPVLEEEMRKIVSSSSEKTYIGSHGSRDSPGSSVEVMVSNKRPSLKGPPKPVLADSAPRMIPEFEPQHQDVQVTIEKIESVGSGDRKRIFAGMEMFPAGTTANETCTKVAEKYGSSMGIWLLQRRVPDPENHPDVEDGCYLTIRDSKHQLDASLDYVAVYFSGSQMFIFG